MNRRLRDNIRINWDRLFVALASVAWLFGLGMLIAVLTGCAATSTPVMPPAVVETNAKVPGEYLLFKGERR